MAPDAHWLILTPSIDDPVWRQAISSAVAEVGLILVEADSVDDPERVPVTGEVWLTDDAQAPRGFGHTPCVIFMPRPETAPEALAERLGLPPPHSVRHASRLLARAVDEAATGTLLISQSKIQELADRHLRLNDWLSIQVPRSGTAAAVPHSVQSAMAMFADGPPSLGAETRWSEDVFEYDARAARDWPAVGQMDITGRPRILVYGPYFVVSRGTWQARVRFAVDREAAKRQFRIDWGTPADYQSTIFHPKASGVYQVDITRVWDECDQAELRLLLMEGAFDGRVDFLGVTVSLLAKPDVS